MIIKATFNDNDFTDYLEQFFDEFYVNLYLCLDELEQKSKEEFNKKWFELDNIYKRTGEKVGTLTKNEISYFLDSVKQSIITYLKNLKLEPSTITYLAEELKVKCVKQISDTCKNNEVVYYFTMHHKCISM